MIVRSQQRFHLPPYLMCNPLPASPTGILYLASGCYVRCLNPTTSRVSLLGAAIATQAVGTAMANPRNTAESTALPTAKAKDARRENVWCRIKLVARNPQIGKDTKKKLAVIEQRTGGVGGDENPYSHIGLCAKPLRQCWSSGDRVKLLICFLIAPLNLPQPQLDYYRSKNYKLFIRRIFFQDHNHLSKSELFQGY